MKRIFSCIVISLCVLFLFASCSKSNPSDLESNDDSASTANKTMYIGAKYAVSSVDAHKDYRGWQTSIYGITETLFKINDDFSLEPWLAESGELKDLVWTISLKDNVCFSNKDPLTADMVVRNLERVSTENPRFEFLGEFEYEVLNDKTFTISTKEPYPTMLNVLSSCETAIIHLDEITDFDNTIVATGPFVLKEFEPEGTIKVSRNENYWNGDVFLDGAEFYHIPEEDALLLAMQNGEIDTYMNVNQSAAEIFEKDKESYKLVNVPSPRLQLYILNQNTLDLAVRKAINLTVDNEKITEYLGGVMVSTMGPFSSNTPYGKVNKEKIDTEKAVMTLEEAGYTKNSNGYFEKDGKQISVRVAFYPGRSLDVIATLMQEQLKQIGIEAVLESYEGPDDYISTANFDIALLSMNADIYGDPEYFIVNTLKQGSHYNVGGFKNEKCESLINQLSSQVDVSKRAELANEIIQIAVDDYAFGYLTLANKITVLKPGVTGFAETSPYDFYGINANSDKVN